MRWERKRRMYAGAGALALALVVLSACGGGSSGGSSGSSSGGSSVSVDVGNGQKINVKPPLNVGIFTSAATATFGQAEDAMIKQAAAAHPNIKITIFDAQFNSALQLKQLQSAIQTKKYNVLGVLPVDGQVICKTLSQDAPAAGLLVVDFDQPLCGRFTNEGQALWQPGTLDYISGYDTKDTLRQWINAIASANSGNHSVAVVEGVASDGLSTNTNLLVKQAAAAHPGFNVVSTVNTDYSSQQGYQKTQALLQAHPDVSVIICTQSNITEGAARAVQQAGKTKSVFLADYGGSKDVVDLMKKAEVQMTGPTYPASEGKDVVQTLLDVLAGKTVPRFVPVPFQVITQSNLSSYTPEY